MLFEPGTKDLLGTSGPRYADEESTRGILVDLEPEERTAALLALDPQLDLPLERGCWNEAELKPLCLFDEMLDGGQYAPAPLEVFRTLFRGEHTQVAGDRNVALIPGMDEPCRCAPAVRRSESPPNEKRGCSGRRSPDGDERDGLADIADDRCGGTDPDEGQKYRHQANRGAESKPHGSSEGGRRTQIDSNRCSLRHGPAVRLQVDLKSSHANR
jgi:hypothetical protein